VGTINRAFNVNVRYYRHPTESRTFYSPDREPTTVGLNVPLLQVTGMNNYVLPSPLLRHLATTNPAAGSGPSGQFLPSDLRAAYYGNGHKCSTSSMRSAWLPASPKFYSMRARPIPRS
jgi:hypothetical protein